MRSAGVKSKAVTLKGGLDQVSPQLSIGSGRVVNSQNYYLLPKGGYRRLDGYSRYSGGWQLPNSDDLSAYQVLLITKNNLAETGRFGVTGSASNAHGYIANRDHPVEVNADEYLIVMAKTTGAFAAGDTLRLDHSAAPLVGTVLSVGIPNEGDIEALERLLAASIEDTYAPSEATRNTSGYDEPVGGVRAVHLFKGHLFAVRQLGFEDHLLAPLQWSVYSSGIQPDNWISAYPIGGGDLLTAQGTYEFVNYNFKGHENDEVMFGVNGKNRAFYVRESPGDSPFIRYITTGMADDKPTHIAAFKNHLFLSFSGGSLQHSSIGDFEDWSPVTGAAELTTGEEITALKVLPGNSLGIFCQTKILILSGTSVGDWTLNVHTDAIGSLAGTAQNMPMVIFADERGITALSAADTYGDFSSSMISHDFDPLYKKTIRNFIASSVSKSKSQYRLFADDGTAIYITFDRNQPVGAMEINLGIPVTCVCHGEDSDGNERTFFGSEDGYVYELDVGVSFGGSEIEHWLRMPFNHLGSPRQKKRFRRLTLDIDSDSNVQLYLKPEFDYGSQHKENHRVANIQINEGVRIFEHGGEDVFTYDYDPISDGDVFIAGTGVNTGLTIYGKSATETPHTLYSVIYDYTPRALKR